ncbi:MAG: hypothetical protein ACOYBP_04085 [Microbacteriaceae bacterium]
MTDPYEGQNNPVIEYAKKRWLGVLIAVLVIIFVVQNGLVTQSTTVYLFFWQMVWPNWVLMLVVFLAGWVVGSLLSRRKRNAAGK